MSSCKFCGSEKETVLVNGTCLCKDCYTDLVKTYQDMLIKLFDYAPTMRVNLDDTELHNKKMISDFRYCYEHFKDYPTFICDERLLYQKSKVPIDIFPFVKEFITFPSEEHEYWNKFVNNNDVPGCEYFKCSICKKWKLLASDDDIVFGDYCTECYSKIVKKYQHAVLVYYDYLDSKLDTDHSNKVRRILGDNHRCQDYFKSTKLKPNDDLFYILKSIAKKINIMDSDNEWQLENRMKAVFNSYLNDYKDDERVFGKPMSFYVPGGCKVCSNGVECYEDKNYSDFIQIERDPDAECWECRSWDSIEKELLKKYGWNPGWRTAIANFAKDGRNRRYQADPNKLNVYLKAQGIVMTDDVIDFWNNLFERRNGSHIIKFYAFDDNIVGKAQQQVGRAIGGLLRDLFG